MLTENFNRPICIIGTGGAGREALWCLEDCLSGSESTIYDIACFMETDNRTAISPIPGIPLIPKQTFDPDKYDVIVAVGNPAIRRLIVSGLPAGTQFKTLIHPSVIMSRWVEVGMGAVIAAGTIITSQVKIGAHAQLNLATSISHDCITGPYFTTAPGVHISGNCTIGTGVYMGTNSAVRQGITICDNVTIGMGSVVVKNIMESGVYTGIPAKQISG